MSLFEIEINDNFKIRNDHIFFQEKHFKDLYKKNNLNNGDDKDIDLYLPDEYMLRVDKGSILVNQNVGVSFEVHEIESMIDSDIYSLYPDGGEQNLYPEWLLFYIAVKKKQVRWIFEQDFHEQLYFFKYIAEIRHKEYVIRNTKEFIPISQRSQAFEIRKSLHSHYLNYIRNTSIDIDKLSDFLGFLCKFHDRLKESEKYKLMWNLEAYIEKVIWLLHEKGISYEEIYTNPIDSNCVGLQDILIYRPLYIKQNENLFQCFPKILQNIFGSDVTTEVLMEKVITKPEYESLLFTYIQLIERWNSNKISEVVLGALARSMILDVEEILRDRLNKKGYSAMEKLANDTKKLEIYRNDIPQNLSGNDFFDRLQQKLYGAEESLEKYLMIFYHARNHFAHGTINIYKLFEEMDDKTRYIHKIIASVIVILYRLEDFDTSNNS